jgi:hypothetical protein
VTEIGIVSDLENIEELWTIPDDEALHLPLPPISTVTYLVRINLP